MQFQRELKKLQKHKHNNKHKQQKNFEEKNN